MNTNIKLHIVAFNIPYPPDYGGVIDVFYKIKALKEVGAKIYLHCFEYGRKKTTALEEYCEKIFYYERKRSIPYLLSKLPYIVATRNSKLLLKNILNIKAPILFEGLHTCFFIDHPLLKEYKKAIRMHNIEYDYYNELAKVESNWLKKTYFLKEAAKLKHFEKLALENADFIFPISPADQLYFNKIHHNSEYIPAFNNYNEVISNPGKGDFILFHGNLEVNENQNAALYLIENIMNDINYPFIIAGKNPSNQIIRQAEKYNHIKVIANPDYPEMQKLISNAHICLIPTFQATGMKLKLLGSLFAGKFCITNEMMVRDTGLESLCLVANSEIEMINEIKKTLNKTFTEEEIQIRKDILHTKFSNNLQAEKLLEIIRIN